MSALLPPLFDTDTDQAHGELRLGVAADCDLRWATVDLTAPVEAMRQRYDASPVATVALGRTMAAAVLLLRFSTKVPGRLRVEIAGDGALGKVLAEADADGQLRAVADNLHVDDPEIDVGKAVGKGLFRVNQQSSQNPEPWLSQTELIDGEIGTDLVHYLHQSQQVTSAALLAVVPGTNGVVAAGGLLIEALPGAQEDSIATLERNIAALGGVGDRLVAGGCRALLEAVIAGLDHEELESYPIRYTCSCSRQTLLDRLQSLTAEELTEVAGEDGKAIVKCAFCLGQFMFPVDELLSSTSA